MIGQLGRGWLRDAHAHGYAMPAFNVSNLETTQGVIAAAEAAHAPVFLQLSPGALAYAGFETLTRLVADLADRATVPVVVHLDHCRDRRIVERAIAEGFGSVMFDGSELAFDENVAITRELVERARRRDEGISVEAELGRIGGREDTAPEAAFAARTTIEDAARFAAATGIDVIAPALGNLHRMPDDSTRLDLERIRGIAAATGLPIALHGGSGIDQAQLHAAIAAGIGKVNISSRVTRALAAGIRDAWDADPEQLDLRRFLGRGREAVQAMAAAYLALCGVTGRADTEDGRAIPTPDWTAHGVEVE